MKTSPVIYRAASKGKVFTRSERIRIINHQKALQKIEAMRKEMVAIEKARVKLDVTKRKNFFAGVTTMLELPSAKLRHGKKGLFLQGRNERGGFMPAIAL